MLVALSIFLLIFSIIIHELGHAVALYNRGIKIKEIGFGFGIPYLGKLSYKFKIKRFPDIDFSLNPLFLGAFVETENSLENLAKIGKLPNSERYIIYGAGIIANILFAIAIIVCVACFSLAFNGFEINRVSILCGCIFLFAIISIFRDFFCKYLIPFFGFGLLVFLVWSMSTVGVENSGVVGPVGVVKLMSEFSTSLFYVLIFSTTVSLSLGIFNCLPFLPLDGGQIVAVWFEKWPRVHRIYADFTFYTMMLFIFFVIANDIKNLFI